MRKTRTSRDCAPKIIISFLLGIAMTIVVITQQENNALVNTDLTRFDVCFSPEGKCEKKIIQAIDAAKKELLEQSYSFTSKSISSALVNAHKRGIRVVLLHDKGQLKAPYLKYIFLEKMESQHKLITLPE